MTYNTVNNLFDVYFTLGIPKVTPAIVEILAATLNVNDLPLTVDRLRAFEEKALFETLFPLSVQPQIAGKPAAFAAQALYELNPRCPLSAKAAVEALLDAWDVSIEEVVFYLMRQFGLAALRAARTEILLERKDNPPKRLETIRYWGNIWLEREYAEGRLGGTTDA